MVWLNMHLFMLMVEFNMHLVLQLVNVYENDDLMFLFKDKFNVLGFWTFTIPLIDDFQNRLMI